MNSESNQTAERSVFLHVSKTGGMTFRKILSTIYGDSLHVMDDPSFEAIESALAKFDCVEFHSMPYQNDFVHLHTELKRRDRWDLLDGRNVFTMFREPVAQTLSMFYFMGTIRSLLEPTFKASGVPFPDKLEEILDQPAYFNNQLAFLAGKSRWSESLTAQDLSDAKAMLLRVRAHIGLTERFADSLHVFEEVTGRQIPGRQVHNQNQNSFRVPLEAVSNKVRDHIREQSGLDNELYDFAKELFYEDLAHCSPVRSYSFIDETKPVPKFAPPATMPVADLPERAGVPWLQNPLGGAVDAVHGVWASVRSGLYSRVTQKIAGV
jgi:hypothetical protein